METTGTYGLTIEEQKKIRFLVSLLDDIQGSIYIRAEKQ